MRLWLLLSLIAGLAVFLMIVEAQGMVTDTTDLTIIRESEWGIYDTQYVQAVYCVRRPNGSHYIRLTNGKSYVTSPKTVVIEED